MTLTIDSAGNIARDGSRVHARITGSSPRILTTRGLDPLPGERVQLADDVDVTHAWGSPLLPAIVEALLAGAPLPDGVEMRRRASGVLAVRACHLFPRTAA